MNAPDTNCWGCVHCAMRVRQFNRASRFCTRYQRPATLRCIDYQSKRSAIKAALDFVKTVKR